MVYEIGQTLLVSLIQLTGELIYLPFLLTAITLLYLDLRIRAEGLDLVVLLASGSSQPINLADITVQAPLPERSRLFRLTDIGNFLVISVGVIGIFALAIVLIIVLIIALIIVPVYLAQRFGVMGIFIVPIGLIIAIIFLDRYTQIFDKIGKKFIAVKMMLNKIQ